jgi:hypothetical protein
MDGHSTRRSALADGHSDRWSPALIDDWDADGWTADDLAGVKKVSKNK